jgi:MSHA biogenesis protein MshJ
MKQYWQKLSTKIDALSLRERGIIFAMIAVLVVAGANMTVLDPLFVRQKQLSTKIQAERTQITLIQTQIQGMLNGQNDPDAVNKDRLRVLKQQHAQMQTALLEVQKGLVPPDKMTVLLNDIIRQDGKLRVVSLKTLPTTSLTDPATATKQGAEKAVASVVSLGKEAIDGGGAGGTVYKHGVEITVQGSFPDMVNYMQALEAMPWQLFWGKAKLSVDEYPKATLTLTLFTLSLDKKWLNL